MRPQSKTDKSEGHLNQVQSESQMQNPNFSEQQMAGMDESQNEMDGQNDEGVD